MVLRAVGHAYWWTWEMEEFRRPAKKVGNHCSAMSSSPRHLHIRDSHVPSPPQRQVHLTCPDDEKWHESLSVTRKHSHTPPSWCCLSRWLFPWCSELRSIYGFGRVCQEALTDAPQSIKPTHGPPALGSYTGPERTTCGRRHPLFMSNSLRLFVITE